MGDEHKRQVFGGLFSVAHEVALALFDLYHAPPPSAVIVWHFFVKSLAHKVRVPNWQGGHISAKFGRMLRQRVGLIMSGHQVGSLQIL
jgi:hypothetical protein